ncbi:uncharacterized protein LOC126181290 [Schistocerca cancellata]|uniref:uncharacterized protein LOC126181290 n=1 Tax=Schistocerca cancellata TaxID=274614 RepID=UPI002118AD86|nr:uncharacterized protein LOC126181290 [Schistocerca cancellata]
MSLLRMDDTGGAVYITDTTAEELVTKFMYPEKAVAKRKSSIFTRRSSVAFMDKEDPCDSSSDAPSDNYPVGFEAYVEILKNEINDWKIMYKQRRETRKEAMKQFHMRKIVNQDVFDALTEEDKIFLASKPNYDRTGKDALAALEWLPVSVERARNVERSISELVPQVELIGGILKKRIIEESVIQ